MIELHHAGCIEVLKTVEENSIDSIVCDPPAGISFMGKEWDKSDGFIPFMTEAMKECLRVLKPGAHGFVWAIPRTSHWTATALEDAGFEIRDVVTHLFGSGFPKSLDISKALDKRAGVDREVIGKYASPEGTTGMSSKDDEYGFGMGNMTKRLITSPTTQEAKQWQGWGTALKPASEHWILVRKPCSEKTIASNVLKHGTGGINIDASRIKADKNDLNHRKPSIDWHKDNEIYGKGLGAGRPIENLNPQGRFPANLVLSHNEDCESECTPGCAVAELDRQSGQSVSRPHRNKTEGESGWKNSSEGEAFSPHNDSRGASRFFYCAKASKRERNEGCEGLPDSLMARSNPAKAEAKGTSERERINQSGFDQVSIVKNHHPTVKPIKLMSYLITMITPPEGIVLDPFMGSGSTGVAAIKDGFSFLGIEKEKEYYEIAKKRIYHKFPEFKKDILK